MFEKASFMLIAACVCAVPARASAFTCENACDNDLAVGERVPVGAQGVLMFSWGDGLDEDTSEDWSVQVERQQADGSYAVVPHTIVEVPYVGAMVRPEQMDVGDVFRIETSIDGASEGCAFASSEPVVHEFEIVQTPALRGFDWLTVEPAVVTAGLRSDFDPETAESGPEYMAKSSDVRVEVALGPSSSGGVRSSRSRSRATSRSCSTEAMGSTRVRTLGRTLAWMRARTRGGRATWATRTSSRMAVRSNLLADALREEAMRPRRSGGWLLAWRLGVWRVVAGEGRRDARQDASATRSVRSERMVRARRVSRAVTASVVRTPRASRPRRAGDGGPEVVSSPSERAVAPMET